MQTTRPGRGTLLGSHRSGRTSDFIPNLRVCLYSRWNADGRSAPHLCTYETGPRVPQHDIRGKASYIESSFAHLTLMVNIPQYGLSVELSFVLQLSP